MRARAITTTLPRVAVVLTAVACGLAQPAAAQVEGRFGLTADGAFVQPVFGLDDRFAATGTGSVGFGVWTADHTFIEGRAEWYAFRQGDIRFTDNVMTDEGPIIDADQLNLTLDILGASVHIRRLIAPRRSLRPFLTAGAGIYSWVSRRDPYEDENRTVEALRQAQVSGGFHAGAGIEHPLAARLSLDASVRHTLIMGELWPSLHLGLDNVSTFQFTSARLGLRLQF